MLSSLSLTVPCFLAFFTTNPTFKMFNFSTGDILINIVDEESFGTETFLHALYDMHSFNVVCISYSSGEYSSCIYSQS